MGAETLPTLVQPGHQVVQSKHLPMCCRPLLDRVLAQGAATKKTGLSRLHTILAAMSSAPRPTNGKKIAVGECGHLDEVQVSIILLGSALRDGIASWRVLLMWQM